MGFILAVLFVCAAHFVRVYRWELFVETYEKPDSKSLVQALGIGYLCNFVLPFHAGDLIRAFYAGKRMKNGRGFSLATVIVDRYLDILAVGVLFVLISCFYADGTGSGVARFYMAMSAGLLCITILLYALRGQLKKICKKMAELFNPHMEVRMLYFFWSLIWSFKDIFGRISKKKLFFSTIAMWALYLASYGCLASLLESSGQIDWTDVFFMLFAESSIKNGGIHIFQVFDGSTAGQWGCAAAYLLGTSAILFVLSLFMGKNEDKQEQEHMNLLPYRNQKEQLNFLRLYFSDSRHDYIERYLEINRDILVIRDYSAGSNATTMLCMEGSELFFRKYAFGDDAQKLYEQITWIEQFKTKIPLPVILKSSKGEGFCYYDMPYDSSAAGLFQYAHSMPKEYAWKMVRDAVECLEKTLYQIDARQADKTTIETYLASKVDANLKRIQNAEYLSKMMDYEEISINGKTVKNLPYYFKYLKKEHLYQIFCHDTYAKIHGDLTIENIICTRNPKGEDSFYIIDPNTGNVHDSPNLDYGKLLQSIHGGYEFLMAAKSVERSHNSINFIFTKSSAYAYLHKQLDAYMNANFSKERIRSIYYHEVIHWLRLLPYKIEKDGKRVLLFYAGLLLVLHDVTCRFEESR